MTKNKPILIKDGYTKDATNLLEEAKQFSYDEVFILGIKDGTMYIKKSCTFNRLQTLGAIDEFKSFLLSSDVTNT